MRRLVRPNGAPKNAPPYMRADFAATLLPVRVAKLRAGCEVYDAALEARAATTAFFKGVFGL
jgi:hypothetical protein